MNANNITVACEYRIKSEPVKHLLVIDLIDQLDRVSVVNIGVLAGQGDSQPDEC